VSLGEKEMGVFVTFEYLLLTLDIGHLGAHVEALATAFAR
jgi:hypothetical protein